jgi:hypothetical protein
MDQQTIICSNCKTPNPARNLYCQSCGKPLIAASIYPTASDVTQPVPSQPTEPAPADLVYPPPQAQPEYIPPAPQPPPFTPPPQEPPAYTPPTFQPQYSPPPETSSAPVYSQQLVPPAGQPVVPPAYVAPAPAQPDFFQKTQARAGNFVNAMKKETFSVHTDGWNDLVADEGEKAAEIEQSFVELLNGRGLTYVEVSRVEVTSGLQQRVYQVARHPAGSVAVYTNAAGSDLMLGWDLSIVQKPSWKRMGILVLAALLLNFLVLLGDGYPFIYFLGHLIFGTFGYLFTVAILGLVAGMVLKGDLWYMFIERPDAAARQELSALTMAVHQCLAAAVKKAGLDETGLKGKDSFKAG